MTAAEVTLGEGEALTTEREELIYRQIVEWMVSTGEIGTHVFGPATSDHGMPSYSRSSVVTAQQSRDWHHQNVESRSTGVWALSVDEVLELELLVIDDSKAPLAAGEKRAPGHCFVDYRGMAKADVKAVRYKLYLKAIARGEIPTTEPTGDGELLAATI